MTPSSQLQRFLDTIGNDLDPRSLAYDEQLVLTLGADERLLAEDALMQAAEQRLEPKAIKTLALIRCDRARPVLERLGHHPHGMVRHAALRALGRLTSDPAVIRKVVDGLDGPMAAFTAYDLTQMDGDEAIRGLFLALSSRDQPARYHGFDGLVDKLAIPRHLLEPRQAPLSRHRMLLGSSFPSLFMPAAKAVEDLFQQLQSGMDPSLLDLVYSPSQDPELGERFWQSCGPGHSSYALELLDAMSSHDKEWAIALIVARLQDDDRRSLAAIEQLGLTWAIDTLREYDTALIWKSKEFARSCEELALRLSAPA